MLKRWQIVSIICAVICAGLSIFSYFRLSPWIFLVCICLFTSFMILLAILCKQSAPKQSENEDDPDERIVAIKKEWREETDRLKAELTECQTARASLEEQLASFQDRNTEFMMEIEQLQLENTALTDQVNSPAPVKADEPSLSSVLPKYLPDPSESTIVNLIAVAESVIRELHDDAVMAGITIQVSTTDDELLVKADQNTLRILFRNIIDNSIKYMQRHGSLIITASSIGDDIFIVCKDTGNGLSEQETSHVFELNYQGSNRISGNGLGLFQAKAIVDYYGGTIYAKSTSGRGMGIYIQLPAVNSETSNDASSEAPDEL